MGDCVTYDRSRSALWPSRDPPDRDARRSDSVEDPQKNACLTSANYSNYKASPEADFWLLTTMKIEIVACLLSLALLPACSTTSQSTAERQTLQQRMMAKYANTEAAAAEPAPPAEGPEDIPAAGPTDPDDNPALLPTPLLRYWASSRTP